MSLPRKVVSGGQTGADQSALRAAHDSHIAISGWCPPGRACEGGAVPPNFPLRETPDERSEAAPGVPRSLRTEWNVRDSDATLVFRVDPISDPGTDWTGDCAARFCRPLLRVDPGREPGVIATDIVRWMLVNDVGVLNVAGPSEGAAPGIGNLVYGILVAVFEDMKKKCQRFQMLLGDIRFTLSSSFPGPYSL